MDPSDRQIERLRHFRGRREVDSGLGFIVDQFQRQVARPHQQLGQLAEQWQALVPAALAERTRLRSFARGTLSVAVADSATLYQLDRLLRGGLERRLRSAGASALRRVKLQVGPLDDEPPRDAR